MAYPQLWTTPRLITPTMLWRLMYELQSAVTALETQVRYGNNRGKSFGVEIFAAATALATGDGKLYTPPMPITLNGYNLTSWRDRVCQSTSGTPTSDSTKAGRQTRHPPMRSATCSTRITIDANEYCSLDAATPAVIDILMIVRGYRGLMWTWQQTAGLWVTLNFQLP